MTIQLVQKAYEKRLRESFEHRTKTVLETDLKSWPTTWMAAERRAMPEMLAKSCKLLNQKYQTSVCSVVSKWALAMLRANVIQQTVSISALRRYLKIAWSYAATHRVLFGTTLSLHATLCCMPLFTAIQYPKPFRCSNEKLNLNAVNLNAFKN